MKKTTILSLFAILLSIALFAPRNASAASQNAHVNTSSRFYEKSNLEGRYKPLKKGMNVLLLSISGDLAKVERSGIVGYTKVDHLTVEGKGDTAASKKAARESAPDRVVTETYKATVSAEKLAVYKSASSSSKRLGTIEKGDPVTVRSYNDTWARVERKGEYGYCLRSGLMRTGSTASATVVKPAPTAKPSSSEMTFSRALSSGNHSNEEIIFIYLTKEMNLNAAAACGIVSNIKSESSFRPTAYNSRGGSYGICQWTGNRYTRLKTYCADKGYDKTSLEAQLRFLEYELTNHYTATLSYMRGVSNSASGAYDAGYYWCYNFEVPANRASVSVSRGNRAKDSYWVKYTSAAA